MNRSTQDVVSSEVSRLALSFPRDRIEAVTRYTDLLCKWGRRMNLTGRAEPEAVVLRQLPDAFVLAARLGDMSVDDGFTLTDLGAGAGIPGLVTALLVPRIQLTLIEANSRKCSFLRAACQDLTLAATVCEGRQEALEVAPPDLACSRATWPVDRWISLGDDLVLPGGRVAAFVSTRDKVPPAPPSLELDWERSYTLQDGAPRTVVIYRKSLT